VRKGGNFEKPPVSSSKIGIWEGEMFLGHPRQYGTFAGGDRLARMAEHAVHLPIHLVAHPTSRRCEADAPGNAFRAWAEAQGLLLVPPEDGKRA
jgi:hypothetical protein